MLFHTAHVRAHPCTLVKSEPFTFVYTRDLFFLNEITWETLKEMSPERMHATLGVSKKDAKNIVELLKQPSPQQRQQQRQELQGQQLDQQQQEAPQQRVLLEVLFD